MLNARRLYLYAVAAIALGALAAALRGLVALTLAALAARLRGDDFVAAGVDVFRDQVSSAAALALVALPIWALHWWLAQRGSARDDAAGAAERASWLRAVYINGAIGIALLVATFAARDLLQTLLHRALVDSRSPDPGDIPGTLATLAITSGVIVVHALARRDDARRSSPATITPLGDALDHAVLFAGTITMLMGVARLLGIAIAALLDDSTSIVASDPWSGTLARAVAVALVGLLLWAGASVATLRQRPANHVTTVRRVALVATALATILAALLLTRGALEELLRAALSVADDDPLALRVLTPVVQLVPFVIAAFGYRALLVSESRTQPDERWALDATRYPRYGTALLGLLFAGTGLAGLLAVVFDRMVEDAPRIATGDPWREGMTRFTALAIAGTAVWLSSWYRAERLAASERWMEAHPASERNALPRRLYLYGALGAAAVALLVASAVIVYRLLSAVLGVDATAGSDQPSLATPIATVLVTLPLLAYHLLVLRADLAVRPDEPEHDQRVMLVLTSPPDADIEATLALLRAQLPAGATLATRDD